MIDAIDVIIAILKRFKTAIFDTSATIIASGYGRLYLKIIFLKFKNFKYFLAIESEE